MGLKLFRGQYKNDEKLHYIGAKDVSELQRVQEVLLTAHHFELECSEVLLHMRVRNYTYSYTPYCRPACSARSTERKLVVSGSQ